MGGRIAVDVPTEENACELTGPGPPAREIRQRIARAEGFALGATLTLLDKDGNRLLVFYRSIDGCLWCPPPEAYVGTWTLDFEASGIEGSYTLTAGCKRQKLEVGSSIAFADGVVTGATGAGGGCDSFEGTYLAADGRFTIVVPVAAGHCGPGPVFPDLEVRQRLADIAAWEVDGEELRLLDADGTLMLQYRRLAVDMP